jgi:hypothetical protein
MKLTRLQKRVLQIYWRYHVGGWALAPFLRANWWHWLFLVLYAVLGGWFLAQVSPWAAGLVVGLAMGAAARDVGRLIQSHRTWPLLHEITDWPRVEQLIQSDDKAA